jgi:hypothetical protein
VLTVVGLGSSVGGASSGTSVSSAKVG